MASVLFSSEPGAIATGFLILPSVKLDGNDNMPKTERHVFLCRIATIEFSRGVGTHGVGGPRSSRRLVTIAFLQQTVEDGGIFVAHIARCGNRIQPN
jgi:hypothetical protein